MTGKKWLLIAIAVVVVGLALVVGGPFVYTEFIADEAPAPLSVQSTAAPSGAPTSLDGTWRVAPGSVAGYRVKEILFGRDNVAVGRTNDITGSLVVEGTTVRAGSFEADMTTVKSDQARRDRQFQGRIMDTATYPTARFELTGPIELAPLPAAGQAKTVSANGKLTLHGTTKNVVVQVTARRTEAGAQIAGSIPVTFADYNIPNPSFAAITTEQNGVMEFSLNLTRS